MAGTTPGATAVPHARLLAWLTGTHPWVLGAEMAPLGLPGPCAQLVGERLLWGQLWGEGRTSPGLTHGARTPELMSHLGDAEDVHASLPGSQPAGNGGQEPGFERPSLPCLSCSTL